MSHNDQVCGEVETSSNPHFSKGGMHKCCLYSTDEEHAILSTDYTIEGLNLNQKVCYFYGHHSLETVLGYFAKINFNVEKYLASGQLFFIPAADIYIGTGSSSTFSPDKTIGKLTALTHEAIALGYSGLRVTGEMAWAHSPEEHRLVTEYEAKLNYFFPNFPCDAICQYDTRTFKDSGLLLNVLNCHPIAMIGLEEFDNIYYMPPEDFLVEDKNASTLKHWIKNLRERKSIETRLRQRTKDLLIMNERLQSEIELKKKIQSEKETAEAVTKAQRAFLRIMSHELRTPLNGIMCMTNMLAETPLSSEQREYLAVLDVSSQHLLTVLSDMLDYSKLETGEFLLEEKSFSVPHCIVGVIDLVKEREKPVDIIYNIDRDVPAYVIGDVSRVRQVLFNLLSNAIKFTTRSDGSITINVSIYNRKDVADSMDWRHMSNSIQILFSVKDNGIGIPQDKWDKIFISFTQLDSSITRKWGGTGLGLSISKKLVELMGGSIWLESKEDVGSTFFFTIAAKIPAELPVIKNINGKRVARSAPTRPLRVLVAEDNMMNQKVISKMLEKLEYTAKIVNNGLEAVNAVEEEDFDCIFMDLLMPVMGGFEATRIINGLDWDGRKKPVIIAMTASASDEDRNLCYEAGMEYHISKPINIDIVKQALDCLERGKQLKTLRENARYR